VKRKFKDIFSKERFQQEVAEEIAKDFRKNLTNSLAQNDKNRHS
jgi:hypothetical protein